MNMFDNFFSQIENIFNIEKISKDLYKYLEIIDFNKEIFVSTGHELTGKMKTQIVDKEDLISIIDIYIVKKFHNQLFLPYQVNIVIGKFENSFGVVLANKFRAEMFYGFDYELITIDFIHNIE